MHYESDNSRFLHCVLADWALDKFVIFNDSDFVRTYFSGFTLAMEEGSKLHYRVMHDFFSILQSSMVVRDLAAQIILDDVF